MFGVDDLFIASCAATVWGYFNHKSADKKNRKAQRKIQQGRERYEAASARMQQKLNSTMQTLTNYGNYKHFVMDTSIKRFYHAYKKIGNIEILEHDYNSNLPALMIKPKEIEELHINAIRFDEKMINAGKGAAAGAIFAVATSGYLPVVAELSSVAGKAFLLGELELGASVAGTAGSLAASAVSLPCLLGPAILFSGFSAVNNAKENLSNAKAYLSEVDAAIAKMHTHELKLDAVNRSALLYATQIRKCNKLFTASVNLMEIIVDKNMKKWWQVWKSDKVDVSKLSIEEKRVIRVACALAKYIKTIIDSPILYKNDIAITQESIDCYNECNNALPRIESMLNATEQLNIFDEDDIKRIENHAVEIQDIDPNSELANQLISETKQLDSSSVKLPFNVKGLFLVIKKLFLLLLLVFGIYASYQYIWPAIKGFSLPSISLPKVSLFGSDNESKSSTINNIKSISQKVIIPALSEASDTKYGFKYYAPSEGVESDIKSTHARYHYKLIDGKMDVLCEAAEKNGVELRDEYHNTILADGYKKIESVQKDSWYYSVMENQDTKEVFIKKYFFDSVIKQGVTVRMHSNDYNNPELKDLVKRIIDNFKPAEELTSKSKEKLKKLIGSTGTIKANEVNVRKGFSVNDESLGVFFKGDKVKIVSIIIENSAGESWYKVEYNNPSAGLISGWVRADFIDVSQPDKNISSQDSVDKKDSAVSQNNNSTSNAGNSIKMKSHTDPGLGVSFVYPENIAFNISGSGLERSGQIKFADKCFINVYQENAVRNDIDSVINYEKYYLREYKDASIRKIPNNGYEWRSYDDMRRHYVIDKVYLVGDKTKHMRFIYTGGESQEIMNTAQKILDSFSAK